MEVPLWSAAPSFTDVVGTGAAVPVTVLRSGPVVVLGDALESSPTSVEFSWKTPPANKDGVAEALDDAIDDQVAATDDDTTTSDDEVVVFTEIKVVDVVVGGGGFAVVFFFGGGGGGGGGGADDGFFSGPPALNTTMFAFFPLGTVTTQKSAPPTPVVLTGLSTPPTPSVAGLMEHGKPLQPPSGHSILRPNVGLFFFSAQPMNIGFHAILT